MVLKKFLDLKFFPQILAETPLFFPDWKKFSKISLIGGNPENFTSWYCYIHYRLMLVNWSTFNSGNHTSLTHCFAVSLP